MTRVSPSESWIRRLLGFLKSFPYLETNGGFPANVCTRSKKEGKGAHTGTGVKKKREKKISILPSSLLACLLACSSCCRGRSKRRRRRRRRLSYRSRRKSRVPAAALRRNRHFNFFKDHCCDPRHQRLGGEIPSFNFLRPLDRLACAKKGGVTVS